MGLGYKDWQTKQRLHTREGWASMTNWIGDNMNTNKWDKETKYGIKWLAVVMFITFALAFFNRAEAWVETTSDYSFVAAEDITMDVTLVNGTSGTYQCPSAQNCYIKALEYEARGAQQYCVSLVMKRNGVVIWHRRYR